MRPKPKGTNDLPFGMMRLARRKKKGYVNLLWWLAFIFIVWGPAWIWLASKGGFCQMECW